MPDVACANIVDELNLAPFVPVILNSMMMIATRGYNYFVGDGDGIIYLLIWGFLALSITLEFFKMYFPKNWLGYFGFSGGGEIFEGKITGMQIFEKILRPGLRAVIAVVLLLQIRPTYMTQWLVNPFLELGSIYTRTITDTINDYGHPPKIECPADILEQGWISKDSCEFLVQPVSDLSNANNQIIKRGFDLVTNGLRGLLVVMVKGGDSFLEIITGGLLIWTFVGCNLFMAMLIIQGIFGLGVQLILYPFKVFTYVVKDSGGWLNLWPVFDDITKALQNLIVTMIACSFMLCVNLAVIRALFQWNKSIFVVAAGGSAYSNLPNTANTAMSFGEHSMVWVSAALTFYLFFKIFDMTQAQLKLYTGNEAGSLYNATKKDPSNLLSKVRAMGKSIGTATGWFKKG